MKNINKFIWPIITLTLLVGCGGGGGSSSEKKVVVSPQTEVVTIKKVTNSNEETIDENISQLAEASTFLTRATFGATIEELEDLEKVGDYEQWIDLQFTKIPSSHIDWAETNAIGVGSVGDLKDNPEDWRNNSDALNLLQRDAWLDIAVSAEDQLRQRVAFALSEIMVISKYGALINFPDSRMSYYDVLVDNAFGNFETLLQKVTYHPAMGIYLSYLGNAKENTETGSHPDENYAREVIQLFTIGLYELNTDGSKKIDSEGNFIPTYTQNDVSDMAKVFTGLTTDNGYFFSGDGASTHNSRTSSMVAEEGYHDRSEKSILGTKIASGGDTKTDINTALNILFNHDNVGPFIAKRLIQRLTTSNPSLEFIEYVALIFSDNGAGVRGDMKAVIKAILLYDDTNSETFGKLKEPLLFVPHLFRAFNAQKAKNTLSLLNGGIYTYNSFNFHGTGYTQQEGALESLTIFNYFSPDDAPDSLKKEGLVAPEFKLYGTGKLHELLMGLINKDGFIYETYEITAELQLEDEKLLLKNEDYDGLLDRLDILLLGGNMDDITRTAIKDYITSHTELSNDILARHVISLVMTSPDFAIQR